MFPNELTVPHTVVLQGGHDMEDASSPTRGTIVRRDNDNGTISLCDGIRVDGEWEHQSVPAAHGCRSVEACMSFAASLPSSDTDYVIVVA